MFNVFIHIIRVFLNTDNVDGLSITQEVFQAIANLKQERKVFNGKKVALAPDILFYKYMALYRSLTYKISLFPITLCTVYFTVLTSEVVYMMVSEKLIVIQLQPLTSKETQLSALQFVR